MKHTGPCSAAVAALVVIVVLTLTFITATSVGSTVGAKHRENLIDDARTVAEDARATLITKLEIILTLANVFQGRPNASHPVAQADFETAINSAGLWGTASTNIAVTSLVPHSERAAFEHSAGSQIMDARMGMMPTRYPNSEFYMPVVLAKGMLEDALFSDLRGQSAHPNFVETGLNNSASIIVSPVFTSMPGRPCIDMVAKIYTPAGPAGSERSVSGLLFMNLPESSIAGMFSRVRVPTSVSLYLVDVTDDTPVAVYSSDGLSSAPPGSTIVPASDGFYPILCGRKWSVHAAVSEIDIVAEIQRVRSAIWTSGIITALVLGVLVACSGLAAETRSRRQTEKREKQLSTDLHIKMLQVLNHELRNPLTIIRGGLEGIMDAAPATLHEQLRGVSSAASTMNRALNELLDLGAVQNSEIVVRPAPVAVGALARDITEYFKTLADQPVPLSCSVNVPEVVLVDRLRLRQALVATLYRCREYTPNPLRVMVEAPSPLWLVFCVCDLQIPAHVREAELFGKRKPTEADKTLEELEWQPPSDSTTRSSHATPLDTMGPSRSWSHSEAHNSGAHIMNMMELPVCFAFAQALGGTMGIKRGESASMVYFAIPVGLVTGSQAGSRLSHSSNGSSTTSARGMSALTMPRSQALAAYPGVKSSLEVYTLPSSVSVSSLHRDSLPQWLTSCRVVVVDDEKLIRRLVSRRLKDIGAEVAASLEDGDELVASLDRMEAPPTCVLLDIVMKRTDGCEVLQQLLDHPVHSSIPVYAMTSNVENVDKFIKCGFKGLLGKPFTKRGLAQVLTHSAASRSPCTRSPTDGDFIRVVEAE